MIRLLVTGSREWGDLDFIRDRLGRLMGCAVIQGEAPGADTCAATAAEQLNLVLHSYPAWWNCEIYEEDQDEPCLTADGRHRATHGKPAGILRNQRMLDESKPDLVWAFHDDLENSKGTKDMVARALKAGLQVIHYSHENPKGQVL